MTEVQEKEGTALATQAEAAERRLAEMPAEVPHEQDRGTALMRMMERTQDPDTLGKMLDLYRRWEEGEARKSYTAALARAQGTMPIVSKNAHVYFPGQNGKADTDYWHADYGNLVDTIKPHLSREGMSFEHETEQKDGRVFVTCILTHEDGHSKSATLSAPPDDTGGKNAIQQVKSTVTYLKRATLELVSGAATEGEDDDGYASEPVETITEEQLKRLDAALIEVGADAQAFFKYLGIEVLTDLPAADYGKAMQALEAKRRQASRNSSEGD